MSLEHTTHDSDQFELELDDARVRVPWDGRSPRGLTRVALSRIFKAQAAKSVCDLVCPGQLEFSWLDQKGPPGFSRGAPLLLEPEEG